MGLAESKQRRWLYVTVGIIIFICLGTVYSWSVFKTPYEQYYGLTAAASGIPYLLFLVFYTLFMLISGKAVDKHDPRVIIAAGGALVAAGWIFSGLIHNAYSVMFFYGIVSGSGVGIVYGVPIKAVSSAFTKKKGLALGLLLSGFGLSPFVTAPVTALLLAKTNLNQTFIIIGLAFLVIIPALGLFFKKNGVSLDSYNDKDNESAYKILKDKKFIGLWLCFALGASVGLMVIGVTSQIGSEMFNISSAAAAAFISMFAVFNALGRPLFGAITDKFSPYRAAVVSFALILTASFIMLFIKSDSPFIYGAVTAIIWMNLGAWLSIAPTATGMLFDPQNYARNYGMLFTAYGTGALIGTPLAGFIRISFESYRYIFIPAAVFAVLGIIFASVFIKDKNKI